MKINAKKSPRIVIMNADSKLMKMLERCIFWPKIVMCCLSAPDTSISKTLKNVKLRSINVCSMVNPVVRR